MILKKNNLEGTQGKDTEDRGGPEIPLLSRLKASVLPVQRARLSPTFF